MKRLVISKWAIMSSSTLSSHLTLRTRQDELGEGPNHGIGADKIEMTCVKPAWASSASSDAHLMSERYKKSGMISAIWREPGPNKLGSTSWVVEVDAILGGRVE